MSPAPAGPAAPASLVLADDHTLFREALAELIGTEPGFTVLGQTGTGQGAVELAAVLRPDLLLLDVQMPGPGPEAVIDQIGRQAAGTRVVVLTMHDDRALSDRLLARGAAAYLVKHSGRAELLAVLRAVGRGSAESPAALPYQPLSARETEVLALLGLGFSNAHIAARLGIAEATVKRHLTNVYQKLGARSRVDALRLAYQVRLLGPPGPGDAAADIPENNVRQSPT